MKIATIWNTYGNYHIARVNAISTAFPESEIVCLSHCTSQEDYPFFNINPEKYEYTPVVKGDASELTFISSFTLALKLLWYYRPNLVLSCGYERPETLASVIYSKQAKAKTFVFAVNQIFDKKRNKLVEAIKSLYLRFFDGFCVGGFTHLAYLKALGISEQKISLGYNCVDNSKISTLSAQFRATNRRIAPLENYFLCVSRLVKKKNIPTLIKAYNLYRQSLSYDSQPWKLLICGDGELKDEISTQVFADSLSNHVTLLGRVDNFERLVNYYTFAKALILPSNQSEQWGLVVNEAMAAKVPVLVAKQCGCSQHLVKEGINGFTFDGNSVEELANCMTWMHQNQHLIASMGENSWQIVQQYSPETFANNIKSLYESLD